MELLVNFPLLADNSILKANSYLGISNGMEFTLSFKEKVIGTNRIVK